VRRSGIVCSSGRRPPTLAPTPPAGEQERVLEHLTHAKPAASSLLGQAVERVGIDTARPAFW